MENIWIFIESALIQGFTDEILKLKISKEDLKDLKLSKDYYFRKRKHNLSKYPW